MQLCGNPLGIQDKKVAASYSSEQLFRVSTKLIYGFDAVLGTDASD